MNGLYDPEFIQFSTKQGILVNWDSKPFISSTVEYICRDKEITRWQWCVFCHKKNENDDIEIFFIILSIQLSFLQQHQSDSGYTLLYVD